MAVLLIIILSIALLCCVHLYHIIKDKRYSHLRGPALLPLLGNVLEFGSNSIAIRKNLERLVAIHGQIFRIWLGPFRAFVVLTNPKDVAVLFSSTAEIKKAADYHFFSKWLGDGILFSTGDKWNIHRKIINPAFRTSTLENAVHLFNRKGDVLVKKMLPHISSESFNIQPDMWLCALDVISEAIMGVNLDIQSKERTEFGDAVKSAGSSVQLRTFSVWKQTDAIFDLSPDGREFAKTLTTIHNQIDQYIAEAKRESEMYKLEMIPEKQKRNNNCCNSLLAFLVQSFRNGQLWSNREIRDELNTFIFAGHDAIVTAVIFSIHSLAHNPKIQNQVFEEIRYILGDVKSTPATYQQLKSMKYLERVIKETLRKYPPGPILGRELIDDIDLNGKIIPAGTTVLTPIFIMHMNPEIFPNPAEFNPDRFLTEGAPRDFSYSYMPFSAGPRNCIGQKFAMLEMQSLISNIIRNFEVFPTNDSEFIEDLDITMIPPNGINVRLQERLY